jgi:hypothetical protein
MSTRLQLRVNKVMLGEQALSGAVADVIPISREQGAQAYKGVIIPVSSHDTKEIEVLPGRYLVQAYLPSGNRLSIQVDALPEQTTPAVLEARRTANEWLGWQDLIGQRAGEPPSLARENANFAPVSPPEPGNAPMGVMAGPPATLRLAQSVPDVSVWTNLHELSKLRNGFPVEHLLQTLNPTSVQVLAPTFINEQAASFILQPQGLPLGSRHYGIVDRSGTIDLFCLPIPWNRLDRAYNLKEASIDIAVPLAREEYVGVAVHDPDLGTLLGYIATGRLPLANVITREGTDAHTQMMNVLYRKVDNPFAAAASAYVLLQSDPAPNADWHPWVTNLAIWFPWLPDGAVLEGAIRLKFAATDEDVLAASESFLNAWNRGIPMFAPVLRLLLDGVSTLVGDPDTNSEKLEGVLPKIRSLARAMATDQAFTSLRFGVRA